MKGDRWLIPRIQEVFDNLKGATVFKTLDLSSGYLQILMCNCCKEKTKLVCRFGTFQFEHMLFGLMNALSTFQRLMGSVLQGLDFAQVYLDDVVILSRSIEEHKELL